MNDKPLAARHLCFVLMPFGKKPGVSGSMIDFDAVYEELIKPAVENAGLAPLRADEEMTGGIIHKPMFERLLLCEYAVADLTTANANVFYELGIRHAARSWSTVLIYAEGVSQLPFDVSPLRALPYRLDKNGSPADINSTKPPLVDRLIEAKNATNDSPLYDLVDNYPDIDHTKTDVFRDRVQYSNEVKEKLAAARKEGVDAVRKLENELDSIAELLLQVLVISIGELVDRCAFGNHIVCGNFKHREKDLAHDRGIGVNCLTTVASTSGSSSTSNKRSTSNISAKVEAFSAIGSDEWNAKTL